MTVEAALAAIADAGLEPHDIDGLSTYPGSLPGAPAGFAGAGAVELLHALRLPVNWYSGTHEGPGQLSALVNACLAVSAGLCKNVLIFRTVTESTAQGAGNRQPVEGASGLRQWQAPFGAVAPPIWAALLARYHMDTFGLTRSQLGQIPLNGRRNAALNPTAILQSPLSLEDYLSARTIASPLGLYDCDLPCDGSTALVISHIDTAADTRHVPVHVNAIGTAVHGLPSWSLWDDPGGFPGSDAADHLWSRTDLRQKDVDLAQIYDGFSILTLLWLEALGFCERGEGGEFLGDGSGISLKGALPINTSGGQLSAGRLHGFGFLHEAVIQLRGDGGARQVPGAPEVAVLGVGGGSNTGAALLTRGIN
ncbi:thiolase family protein [Rhodococcus wratislaviensis]|uniref:thiolase family protein n=1 Tax=Rhodococcus wratislaviensis TaxID=44752 RepID=UPI00364E1ADA